MPSGMTAFHVPSGAGNDVKQPQKQDLQKSP